MSSSVALPAEVEEVDFFDLRRAELPSSSQQPHRPNLWIRLAAVGLDVVAIAMAFVVAVAVHKMRSSDSASIGDARHALIFVASLPIWIAIFFNRKLYSARYLVRGVEEFRRLTHACAMGALSIGLVSYWATVYVGRGLLIAVFFFAMLFTSVERYVVRSALKRRRRVGHLLRPVLIAGTNVEARSLCSMLNEEPERGYRVMGFLGDDLDVEAPLEAPCLGPIDSAVEIASQEGASGVLVATTSVGFAEVNKLTRDLSEAGFYVEVSSALFDIAPERLIVKPLGSFPFYFVEPVSRRGWRPIAKRLTDITLSVVGLVVLAPLFLLVGAFIKAGSRGPVLFSQERVGRDGHVFRLFKFRTMVPDAEQRLGELRDLNERSGPLFKCREDPRITRVGRFLRRWSLDELPQLINVVRGEMSLVGPRPALPSEVDEWHPEAHGRLRVRPGLTGMWQVVGRSDSFEQYIRLDLYYVDNWSLLTDLVILAKTVPTVLRGRGSY